MVQTLLNNRLLAMLAVLLLAGTGLFVPAFYFFASIFVAFYTLCRGPQEGALLTGWALLPVLAYSLAQSLSLPAVLVVMSCLMVWIMASLLYVWRSWLLVLEVATVVGVLMIAAISLLYPELLGTLAISVATLLKEVQTANQTEFSSAQLGVITHLALGFLALEAIFSDVLALIIARAWQARQFNPGGFGQEFQRIRVGKSLSIILLGVVVAALFQLELALQLLPVIVLPFIFAGVSLVHALVARGVKPANKAFVLGFFYFNLIFFFYFSLPVVIFAAFVDSLCDFRSRIVVQ